MRATRRTRKRALSLFVAAAFVLSMAASVSLDTYYTAPTDPVTVSLQRARAR